MKKGQSKGKKPIKVTGFLADDIDLTISATPNEWIKLDRYIHDLKKMEPLKYDLYYSFIWPALEQCQRKKSEKQLFTDRLKFRAGYLYAFLSYWCKKPLKEWPEYLNKLITIAEKDGYAEYIKTIRGRYDPKELTAYILEKVYGKDRRKYRIKSFENIDNFYITYIHDNKRPARQLKTLKLLQPAEVKLLAYKAPYNDIFNALKII